MKVLISPAFAVIAAAATIAAAAHGDVITQWNFNGADASSVAGGGSSPTAAVGGGTASVLLGVAGSFASGTSNGGSTDPVTTNPPNFGWGTTSYAAQGASSGLAGVQFNVSTVGFEDILISWDQRHSNTSSRYVQLQYSLDGVNFTSTGLADSGNGAGVFVGAAGDTWFNGRSGDLSAISGADNNANFAIRIVAIFAPSTSGYVASNSASSYATTGTWRFDMVTISGTAVPAPGALALLGLAGVISTPRRRRA